MLNNIMIINDDEVSNYILIHKLSALSICHYISCCSEGAEAMDYIYRAYDGDEDFVMPDMIILDLNMPVMGGIEFLNEYTSFVEEHGLDPCPVIIFTAHQKKDVLILREIYSCIKGEMEIPVRQEDLDMLKEIAAAQE